MNEAVKQVTLNTRQVQELHSIPSVFVDNLFIQMRQDSVRITFGEQMNERQDSSARASISCSMRSFLQFAEVMHATAEQLKQAMQAVPEEGTADDSEPISAKKKMVWG